MPCLEAKCSISNVLGKGTKNLKCHQPACSLEKDRGQRKKKENRRENSKSCLCVESQRRAGPRTALCEAQEKPSLQQMKLISWGNSWRKEQPSAPELSWLERMRDRQRRRKRPEQDGRARLGAWTFCSVVRVMSPVLPIPEYHTERALWVVGAEDRSAPAWRDVQDVSHLKAEVKGGTIITRRGMFTSPVSVFCRNQREPAC